jgi:hypothetical protein
MPDRAARLVYQSLEILKNNYLQGIEPYVGRLRPSRAQHIALLVEAAISTDSLCPAGQVQLVSSSAPSHVPRLIVTCNTAEQIP